MLGLKMITSQNEVSDKTQDQYCNFDHYKAIYGDKLLTYCMYDFTSIDESKVALYRILTFDNKGHTWTENDHYLAYNTFFGLLKEEYEQYLTLEENELIDYLKIEVPDSWELYLRIIKFYKNVK